MLKTNFLTTLQKITQSPTRYDNKTSDWASWIRGAWNLDCCRMVKAVLWGFAFIKGKAHGGAVYKNGYPDYTCEQMIATCADVKDMTTEPEAGELLWMPGHVGVYAGNGYVYECSPKLKGAAKSKLNFQPWKKHGKLPCIKYDDVVPEPIPVEPKPGMELRLTQEPLYVSSSRKDPYTRITGTRFVYDGKIIRGRIRVCKTKDEVGKGIDNVEGWIAWR